MKVICPRIYVSLIGLLTGLILHGVTFAQSANTAPSASTSSTAVTAFQQEQSALIQQWRALVSQGATQQQLQAWRQQNAPQIQAQQQRAQALALISALQPMPTITEANVPPTASGTLSDFITSQANLVNVGAQIYNQNLQALPSGATQVRIGQLQLQAGQAFQQQHAADLQLQMQRAQALAAQSLSQPIPMPGPLVNPPNATPALLAFRSKRHALQRQWAELWNQYLNADPATRQAAIQQWQQQNAAAIQQLRQSAQDLSNSTATQ